MSKEPKPARILPPRLGETVRAYAFLAAGGFLFICFGGPFALLAYQAFIWLRDGYWDRWPISRSLEKIGLFEPYIEWVGAQKIVTFIFPMPTAFALPMLGVAFLWTGGMIFNSIEKRTLSVRQAGSGQA